MADSLDDRTYDLLFGIRRSVRYHMRRRRFYEVWNTITVATAVVGGSSAVAAFFAQLPAGGQWTPIILSGIVAIIGAIDLAVGTGRRADLHGDLARQFISLEQRFAHGRNLEDVEHEEIVKARLQIEASEPPVMRLLDALCHFELLRSLGDAGQHPQISWIRRILANWFSQQSYASNLATTAVE